MFYFEKNVIDILLSIRFLILVLDSFGFARRKVCALLMTMQRTLQCTRPYVLVPKEVPLVRGFSCVSSTKNMGEIPITIITTGCKIYLHRLIVSEFTT